MHAIFIDQPPSLPPPWDLDASSLQQHSGISIFNKHPERLWSRKSQGLTSTTLGILASQVPILNWEEWQRARCSCYLPLDKELKQGAFQKKEQKRKLVKNANLHDPPQFVPASYLLLDVSISVSISRVQRHCDGMWGQGGSDFSNSHENFPEYMKSQEGLCERQILLSWEVKWDKEGPLLARSCEVTNELSGSLPSFLCAVVPGTRKASQFTAPGLSWRKTSTRLGFFHSSQHCLQCRQHFMWAPTGTWQLLAQANDRRGRGLDAILLHSMWENGVQSKLAPEDRSVGRMQVLIEASLRLG